jgi:ankyrin repeat protein
MPLLQLANEILLMIAHSLGLERDIYALVRTNRRLYHLLNEHLYRHNIVHSGSRALLWAAEHGRETTTQMLLDAGAAFEPETEGRWTPLLLAAEKEHATVLKLLLDRGANPDCGYTIDRSGSEVYGGWVWHIGTPLCRAAERENEALVKLLLDRGANPDCWYTVGSYKDEPYGDRVPNDRTPLSRAAERGNEALVKLLLDHGATPDFKVHDGQRALSLAVEMGHLGITRLLIAHGASVNFRYSVPYCLEGTTPLRAAVSRGDDTIIDLLRNNGA